MLFQFFHVDFQTPIEEVKRQYHKLCLKWHPDRPTGDEEAMKRVNEEWDYLRKHNFNIHQTKEGGVYTDHKQDRPDDVTERFAAIIAALMKLEGVGIEIVGSFIWLDGNTRYWKDAIKALGFRWSKGRNRWYMAPNNYKRKGSGLPWDEIRARYGSTWVSEGNVSELEMLEA